MWNSCEDCGHFEPGAKPDYANDWAGWGDECAEVPHMANLRSFPFRSTQCPSFEAHQPALTHGAQAPPTTETETKRPQGQGD